MRKLLLLAALFVFFTACISEAQVGLSCGSPGYSFDADSTAAPVNGDSFSIYSTVSQVSWQISFASAPSAINTTLQGSLDNSSWFTVDTSTATAGEIRTVLVSAKFLRARVNSRTGGSGVTVIVNCSRSYIIGKFGQFLASDSAGFTDPGFSFLNDTDAGLMRLASGSKYLIDSSGATSSGYTFNAATPWSAIFTESASGSATVTAVANEVGLYAGTGTSALKRATVTATAVTALVPLVLTGVAFSALGTPADGTIIYCSDCTKATPCAGSSTGALAKRLNSTWDCD